MTPSDLVRQFHTQCDLPVASAPGLPSEDRRELRRRLLQEELNEYLEAEEENDIVAIADALGDLVYVALGCCLEYGIPFDRVFAEIHRSNMTKLGPDGKPICRADGKIMKPKHFEPPQLEKILTNE
jgi:predicted HAD superfamily Cof-like phosphohydrolase